MRLFLGGSNGLALYEDGELTKGAHEGVLCLVRPKPGLVLAGTESGCLLRWDTNAEAEVVAKDLGEAVTALALATGGKVIAGTMPPGIWVSKDGGGSWKELPMLRTAPGCEGWSAPWGPPLVCTIAVHPKDSKTIYCGIEKGGLYRSRDGGKKWLNLTIPASDVHCIQVSPARHERVYVATGNPTGCGGFCSDDGGFTWRTMSLGTQRTYTMGLAAHPSEADRVIISAAEGPPTTWRRRSGARCDVFLSTDAGRRFRTVVRNLKGAVRSRALVINPRVPSEVAFGTSTGDLYYSSDGGESFDGIAEELGDLATVAFA